VRLHASKTVRDGLFLRFLESQRIVQSARDQIGKRAEKQYFFRGEIDILRGFNVEHSMQLLGKKIGRPIAEEVSAIIGFSAASPA